VGALHGGLLRVQRRALRPTGSGGYRSPHRPARLQPSLLQEYDVASHVRQALSSICTSYTLVGAWGPGQALCVSLSTLVALRSGLRRKT
jgi:hypothetical protein